MESMRCTLIVRKLGFVRRQLADSAVGAGATAVRPESLCLVKELEDHFGTQFTEEILVDTAYKKLKATTSEIHHAKNKYYWILELVWYINACYLL